MSAAKVFEMFGDKNGMVSIKSLLEIGWTKDKALEEGIIIKEDYRGIPHGAGNE